MIKLLSVLFPAKCPYCSRLLKSGQTECDECREELFSDPILRKIPSGEYCTAPWKYHSPAGQAIKDMKFRDHVFNVQSLSKHIVRAVRMMYDTESLDVVTCVPMYKASKRERGYNQAEKLARSVAEIINRPYEDLLVKTQRKKVQHELDREGRVQNVLGAYSPKDQERIANRRVLLIDDICTTGSTLSECCKVLKQNGSGEVFCAAAAITGIDVN